MKSTRLFCLLLVSMFTAWVTNGPTSAYDSPNFDYQILDADALLLPPNEQESVVEALNAIACNFPNLVDEDLKEKALALALAIEPLNVNSRRAHFALLSGQQPKKIRSFQSGVSDVAEGLWSSAEKMEISGEPESLKLVKYLRELSLVIHPSPPKDRVQAHAKLTDEKAQPWEKFVKLQPRSNPSNNKLKAVIAKANRIDFFSNPGTPDPEPPRPPKPNGSQIQLTDIEIPFVARTRSTFRTGNLGGTAAISIKEATPDQMDLFEEAPEFGPDRGAQMRIIPDFEGFQLSGNEKAERLIRQTYNKWPEKMLAQVSFNSEFTSRSPQRMTTVDMSLATGLLLQSAFSGKRPSANLVFSGFSTPPNLEGPSFSIGDQIAEVLDQAKAMEAEFILIPDSHYDQIVKGAIETSKLEYLFDPQLISYASWEQLKSTGFGEDEETRIAASLEFKKIQSVQDRMSLSELSRNSKVRERLNQIIADYPQHLSARVMLAFGAVPEDPEIITRQLIRRIDEAMKPVLSEIASAVEYGALDELDFEEIDPLIEAANDGLKGIQVSEAPKVRNYFFQTRDLLKAIESLVNTKRGSPVSNSRYEAVKKAFEEWQKERTELGLERFQGIERERRPRRPFFKD